MAERIVDLTMRFRSRLRASARTCFFAEGRFGMVLRDSFDTLTKWRGKKEGLEPPLRRFTYFIRHSAFVESLDIGWKCTPSLEACQQNVDETQGYLPSRLHPTP